MENSEIIFIIGAHKTATSTLVGMLNCHPEIFLLYETELYQPHISRHAKRFLAQYPDARFLFRSSEDLHALYSQLQEFLKSKGYPYKYVGDKLPGLNANFHVSLNAFKVIFSVRDIRTWLGKDVSGQKVCDEAGCDTGRDRLFHLFFGKLQAFPGFPCSDGRLNFTK